MQGIPRSLAAFHGDLIYFIRIPRVLRAFLNAPKMRPGRALLGPGPDMLSVFDLDSSIMGAASDGPHKGGAAIGRPPLCAIMEESRSNIANIDNMSSPGPKNARPGDIF